MRKTIQQAGILTISNGISKLLSMLFLVILTRIIDVSEYGQFRYILNFASLLALPILGVSTSLTKFLGETIEDKESKKILMINSLGLILVIYIITSIIFGIFHRNYFLFSIFLFGILIESYYLGLSRGLLNILKLAAFRPVKCAIQLTGIGIVAFFSQAIGILEAVLIFSGAGLISSIVLEINRREIEFGLILSGENIKKIVRYMIPVTVGGVGTTALITANPIIIERFRGTESVAYYTAGITLMQVFSFLPEAMSTMILPKVAGIRNKANAIRPFLLGVAGSLTVSLLILIPIYLLKERIIEIAFSKLYMDLAPIVLLLAIGQISMVTHQLFASFWQGLGRPAVPSVTVAIGCVINLVASIMLTKIYGIWGAALSYAVGASCSLLLTAGYFILKKNAIIET